MGEITADQALYEDGPKGERGIRFHFHNAFGVTLEFVCAPEVLKEAEPVDGKWVIQIIKQGDAIALKNWLGAAYDVLSNLVEEKE